MSALTEADASTKWCPFVRYVSGETTEDEGAANRWGGFDNPPPCRCIASKCMAWRWVDSLDPKRGGYCGLAGN